MHLNSLKPSFLSLPYDEAMRRIMETRAMRRLRVVKHEKVKKVTPAKAKKEKVKKQNVFESLPPDVKRKLLENMLKGKQ